VLQGAGYTTPP
jgi:uncharacterized coiled-coil protein SlyX